MAKLVSPLKLSGTIDDLSFCLQEDRTVHVQTKPGPSSRQVKKHKKFANTRRYGDEFSTLCKNAQALRHSLGYLELPLRSRMFNAQVIQRVRKIVDTDVLNEVGLRNANAGDVSLLTGLEFSHQLNFDVAMPLRMEHAMDAATGRSKLWVRSGIVRKKKALPEGATHFRIVSCIAMMDFDKNKYVNDIASSDMLPLSKQMPELELLQRLTPQPGKVMVHTVGIVFFAVNGEKVKRLKGAAARVLEVARVGQELKELEGGKEDLVQGLEVSTEEAVAEKPAVVMAAPALGVSSFVRVVEKERCGECSVEGSWLIAEEVNMGAGVLEKVADEQEMLTAHIAVAAPTLPSSVQELVAEVADGFELGTVDARGRTLEGGEAATGLATGTTY